MVNFIKGFLKEEDGMGVIEIVIIIAVLVALALLFRNEIGKFANGLMDNVFKVNNQNSLNDPNSLPTS